MQPHQILEFWFETVGPQSWYTVNPDLDQSLRQKFMPIHDKASHGLLWDWRKTPQGRLAEIIILDQFSRNMFRNTPKAFAYDPLALILAQEAESIGASKDKSITDPQKTFFYLPFMHSESLDMQNHCIAFTKTANLKFATESGQKHKVIIERFGRFPHRNSILNRPSTLKEEAFLKEANSSF